MFRIWILRKFSMQGAELGNIHVQILAELKKQPKFVPEPTKKTVSELILTYPNVKDRIFLSSLYEISEYPVFSPVLKTLEPKIIEQLPKYLVSELVKLCQAYSKTSLLSDDLFSLLSQQILKQVNNLTMFDAGILLFSIHSSKVFNPLLIENISNRCLSLLNECDKDSLFKIMKSFSLYPDCEFNKKALPKLESLQDELTVLEKINFLELLWKCKASGGTVEKWIFQNIQSFDVEDFAVLVNKCSRCQEAGYKYRERLMKKLQKHIPKQFSSKAIMYTVNGFHELVMGKEVCEYFEEYLEQNISKIELGHICIIMYVFGTKEKGSRFMWRRLLEIIKKDLEKLTHTEKVWAVYGLFKVGRLKSELRDTIFNSLKDKDFGMKDLEKVIEICNETEDKETLKRIKPFFIRKHKDFYPNKGLICIDAYENAKLMDSELYAILKHFKSRIKQKN